MDERIEEITRKLDKILSILDAKSKKLLSDRERIKAKRDDDAAQTAKTRGVIVVDRLTGTCPTTSGRSCAWSLTPP